MTRRDVEGEILGYLQPYLDAAVDRYRREGVLTLPATGDGKVSVVGLVRELGLPSSDAQHFHRKPALADAVNVVAEEVGLAPIGSRALADTRDAATKAEFGRVKQEVKQAGEDVVALRRQIDDLTRELERIKRERDRYAEMIGEIYDGGDLPAGVAREAGR